MKDVYVKDTYHGELEEIARKVGHVAESLSGGEVYDGTLGEAVYAGAKKIANAITPMHAADAPDATGCNVGSLTESVMGMTAALVQIANAIDRLAGAVEERASS